MAWIKIYLGVLKQYAEFQGRATRTEYWVFALISSVIYLVLWGVGFLVGAHDLLAGLYQVATFLPSIAVGARRLHDTNRSGWWQIVPIVSLILLAQRTQPAENLPDNAPRVDAPPDPAEKYIYPVGRSGWAIAAGYLGLFSLIFFLAPFAVICGAIALRDIARHPEKLGKPRAYFGIVMGLLGTALLAWFLWEINNNQQ